MSMNCPLWPECLRGVFRNARAICGSRVKARNFGEAYSFRVYCGILLRYGMYMLMESHWYVAMIMFTAYVFLDYNAMDTFMA